MALPPNTPYRPSRNSVPSFLGNGGRVSVPSYLGGPGGQRGNFGLPKAAGYKARIPKIPGVSTQVGSGPATRATPGTVAPGAAAGSVPGSTGNNPTPSPYDAQYYTGVGQAQFDTNNRINALNQQNAYAQTDLNTQLHQLQQQQPIDTLAAQTSANKAGLLYSGQLGQQIGRLNQSYLDRESADQQNYARQTAARNAAIAALQGGLPLTIAALAAASAARQTDLLAKDPTLGAGGGGGNGAGGAGAAAGSGGAASGVRLPPAAVSQGQNAAAARAQAQNAQAQRSRHRGGSRGSGARSFL